MVENQKFELQAIPGTTVSARKAELESSRYVAVRNLAHLHYKKPDGSPLMTYTETLGDREQVKNTILQYELQMGFIVNDGTPGAVQAPPQAVIPVQVMAGAPTPMIQAPVQPPMQMAPQVVIPPQAAQVVQQPSHVITDVAPAAARPSRRKAAQAGTAVAPPPAAPPPNPAQAVPVAMPQQSQQPMTFAPPPVQQQAVEFVPQAFTPPQVQTSAAPQAPSDQGLMQKIEMLGKGIETSANNGDQALKDLAHVHERLDSIEVMLHHIYMTKVDTNAPKTLPDFLKYIEKYKVKRPSR